MEKTPTIARPGATRAQPPAAQQPMTVQGLLESQKKQIALALPSHMKPDRMLRIALTEIRKNPALGECDPLSFLGAIIQSAQLGLEPGNALGHAYLVPYWNKKKGIREVQLIPGYRGFIDLARRSGQIMSISARVVHENDLFEYEYGLEEKLKHVPAKEDAGELVSAYAVAKLKDGGYQFEIMSRDQIDAISTGTEIWRQHYDEMARKTVVRRLFKYLPVSIELAHAFELADREETGESQDNERILLDVGVQALPAASPLNKAESDRMEVVDRVEVAIGKKMTEGKTDTDIETAIGMPLDKVDQLEVGQLMAVLEIVRKM